MQLSKRQMRTVKYFAVLLCTLLIICLLIGPVKQTISYIQTTSGTCINTFIGEVPEGPIDPTEPTDPTEPSQSTEPTNPTKPTEPSQSTEQTKPSQSADASSSGAAAATDKEKPKTGDDFNAGIWGMLAVTSLLVLVITLLYRSKATVKKDRK